MTEFLSALYASAGYREMATRVSRETLMQFDLYARLLCEENRKTNLVSANSLDQIWDRHFWDCAQLADLISPKDAKIADIGSGAGFPGVVLCLMGYSAVTLFERDQKKAVFLKRLITHLSLPGTVVSQTLEDCYPPKRRFDMLVARACAPLDRLVKLIKPFLQSGAQAWLLKGATFEAELRKYRETSPIDGLQITLIPSKSNKESVILHVSKNGEKNGAPSR